MSKRIILILGFWLFATSFSAVYGGEITLGANLAEGPASYRSIGATVLKVVSDTIFFKTAERTIRTSSVKSLDRSEMTSIKPGDQVTLILDQGNSILEIESGDNRGVLFAGEIVGTVQTVDTLDKNITVKTVGGSRSFELRDAAATKLNGVQEGRIILVLDRGDRVMDAYRP